jgi:cysteine desulfurase/selenocysteine lyase
VTLDVARIRKDFPILERDVHGHRLVYLDSAATSQKPRQVVGAMNDYYERVHGGVHRSVHALGEEATAAYELARSKIARFVNAPDERGVVFTRGTTEGTNLVAYAWVRRRLGPGDAVLASEMEHHSNLVPWQMATKDVGAAMRYIPVTDGGELDLTNLEGLVTERTKLVCITGMSNVLGTIPDLKPIVDAAHSAGALVLVDGAQLVPHHPTDFQEIGCDFLVFSSHKMLGPTGVGALVARPELLEEMEPFLGGGEMIRDVSLQGATWNDVPWKFEAGTMMTAEAVGFGAAIDYLNDLGMDNVRMHETQLARYAVKVLEGVDGLVLYGPKDPERRGAVMSFNVFGRDGELLHPHDVGTMVDQDGIAIRAGHHCAKPLMRRYDVPATCRASAYVYNTEADFDALVESIERTERFFLGD